MEVNPGMCKVGNHGVGQSKSRNERTHLIVNSSYMRCMHFPFLILILIRILISVSVSIIIINTNLIIIIILIILGVRIIIISLFTICC